MESKETKGSNEWLCRVHFHFLLDSVDALLHFSSLLSSALSKLGEAAEVDGAEELQRVSPPANDEEWISPRPFAACSLLLNTTLVAP